MPQRKVEEYGNRMARLFPNGSKDEMTKNLTFQVTDDCNLRCTYCYQTHKGHHSMPFEVAKKFIDMILDKEYNNPYFDSYKCNGVILDFIGGEPLLEIELIDQIVNYFLRETIKIHHPWATKFMISICSNGLLYFDPKVQAFFDKWKNHLSFSITIDGNKKLHDSCRLLPDGSGSYDIAIAAVKDWVSRGYYMGSKITLAPGNIEYTFDALKSIIENGYDDININCVFEEGWTIEHAKILYEQLKLVADYMFENNLTETHRIAMFDENYFKLMSPEENSNWCGGTGAMVAVDYKGDIFPCLRYMESSLGTSQKPMIIGNVYDGFMTKDSEKAIVEELRSITRRSQSTDECWNCPIASGCAWCSAHNYQVFGTANKRATFICVMHKARALANYYYWNKYYKSIGSDKRFEIHIPREWAVEIIGEEEFDKLLEDGK